MRYSGIIDFDVVNGEGIGCSIFFQGCSHHCKGCFNPETWDFKGGHEFTKDKQKEFIDLCSRPFIDFISLLGGEPLDQDRLEMFNFISKLKQLHKPIYVWSGYTWEEINCSKEMKKVILLVDYLIDGEFQEDKKDLKLKLRGSSNQRIIDVQQSLLKGEVVLHE